MHCAMCSVSTARRTSSLSQRATNPTIKEPIHTDLHCSVEDQRRLLGAAPYFRSLNSPQIENVQRQFQQKHYQAGSVIYAAAEPASRLAIVARGAVKVQRPTPDGKDVLLDLLVSGDHFGSLAELGDAIYPDTAIAHTECCILSTTSREFSQMLAQYPSVAIDSLSIVAARLRQAQSTIENLSAYTVEQRIARALIELVGKIGVERNGELLIDIPLSRQDLADMAGTTVETASRIMSEFKRDGLINSGRRWISVLNGDGLNDRAN